MSGLLTFELNAQKRTNGNILPILLRSPGPCREWRKENLFRAGSVAHWCMAQALHELELDVPTRGHAFYRPINIRLRHKWGRNIEGFYKDFGTEQKKCLLPQFTAFPHLQHLLDCFSPRFYGVYISSFLRKNFSIPYPDIDVCVPGWNGYASLDEQTLASIESYVETSLDLPNDFSNFNIILPFDAKAWYQNKEGVTFDYNTWNSLDQPRCAWIAFSVFLAAI